MRILVVLPQPPWPLNTGGKAAQFSALECLQADHEFTLVCPVYGRAHARNAEELAAKLPGVRLRTVHCDTLPARPSLPLRLARRVTREAQRLLESRHPAPPFPSNPFAPLPHPLIEALDRELNQGQDLCQVEMTDLLSLGPWLPREVPKLFVHHQIHYVYSQRFLETQGSSPYARYVDAIMRDQEFAHLQHFDAVIAFSEEDRRALLPHVGGTDTFISPFPIPADVGIATAIPDTFGGQFLFVASEVHGPNRDALRWLLADIWPGILKELPASRLLVVGQWNQATRQSAAAPSVSFAGFVPDIASVLRGGIMLVPIRIGSGIRVKILLALAQGVPVVSTRVGSEGLLVHDGEDVLIRDAAGGFGAAAVQLARDPALWRRLAAGGRAVVMKHYSPERVRARRNEIYAAVVTSNRARSSTDRSPGCPS